MYCDLNSIFYENRYVAPIFEHWMHVVAAGLAYKCTEVAFMKAGFYKNLGTSKDSHNINIALRNKPPGISLFVYFGQPYIVFINQ